MAHNTKMSSVAVNAEAAALAVLASGGFHRIYDGVQPATVETPITDQILLAEPQFGTPAFGAPVNGVITANAYTPDPASAASGEATWYRIFAADGVTPLWDGTVGAIGSDSDLELTSTTIPEGVEVGISGFSHTVTK